MIDYAHAGREGEPYADQPRPGHPRWRETAHMIPWTVLTQGGAVALLAGVVWMIVTGKLVPRRALLDAQEQRDKWAAVAERAMQQNMELLTGARVTREVIRALPDAAAGELR